LRLERDQEIKEILE